jgi:hypothetical protein
MCNKFYGWGEPGENEEADERIFAQLPGEYISAVSPYTM